MATVITRTIASVPHRTAAETWDKIVAIIAPGPESDARAELRRANGVAATSIASEAPKDDAFIIYGNGPQIRIYCAFGDDAVSGDGVNEDDLQQSATNGDWKMSIPSLPEDLDWSQRKLKADTKRITARATGEAIAANESKGQASASSLCVNLGEFLKS